MARTTAGYWPVSHFTPSHFPRGAFGGDDTVVPPPVTPPPSGVAGVSINGLDLSAFSVKVATIDGIGPPGHDLTQVTVEGEPGTVVTVRQVRARDFVLRLIQDTTVDQATLDADRDRLISHITRLQPVEIILSRWPTRRLIADYVESPTSAIGPFLISDVWDMTVPFLAAYPFWLDVAQTSVTGVTTPASALPQGTGPAYALQFRILGPATTPLVTLYDYNGAAKYQMQFTGTLASGEYYAVDNQTKTVYRNSTGAFNGPAGNQVQEFTGNWLQVLREHSHFVNDSWPSIDCTAGTLDAFYYRAWG